MSREYTNKLLEKIEEGFFNVKGKVFKARIFENIERNTEVKK